MAAPSGSRSSRAAWRSRCRASIPPPSTSWCWRPPRPTERCRRSASSVQRELGLSCGAFDLNAACSGWVYGLVAAHGFIGLGAEKILLIGTDTLARITDWTDRNTAILFADGSGAAVIEAVDGPGQLLGWDLGSDGSAEDALYCEVGGLLQMEGKEVFRRAVRIMVESATASMAQAGVTADDIALVVPHQANIRIISASCDRLGIGLDRASVVLDHTGNTSAASIPSPSPPHSTPAASLTVISSCSSDSAPA